MERKKKIARFIDWMAIAVALAITVLPPAGYFILSRQHLASQLQTGLKIKELAVSRHIVANPELWRFEELRLETLLKEMDDAGSGYFNRVTGLRGELLASTGDKPLPPALTARTRLYDAGAETGALEASVSLRMVIIKSVLVGTASLSLGLLVFFPLRIWPRRALHQALDELAKERDALEHFNQILERLVKEEVEKNREKDHMMIQQSRLAAMGEMVHKIAHQWRQPLNTLGLIIQNLRYDMRDGLLTNELMDQSAAKEMQVIQGMSRTIDDFRNFFRPDQLASDFDIAEAVEQSLNIIIPALDNHGIKLESSLERGLLAHGHPSQFAQVVLNLLANAKEAILQHGVTAGQITIRLAARDGWGVLDIEDNGGGIPGDIMGKIFDPYFTSKEQGSGIGLYMSKTIIERNMDGHIEAANTASGARFMVKLPLPASAA